MIGAELTENINSDYTDHKLYLQNKVENSFFLHSATELEIIAEINKLNCKKSPGYDDISVNVLQAAKQLVFKPFMLIFNKAITTGHYPDSLKIAKVVPLFKKGDNTLVNNYQPASLISLLNKVFEKMLYRRLYKFLVKHNVLYKYQFGFRKGYSIVLCRSRFFGPDQSRSDNRFLGLIIAIPIIIPIKTYNGFAPPKKKFKKNSIFFIFYFFIFFFEQTP